MVPAKMDYKSNQKMITQNSQNENIELPLGHFVSLRPVKSRQWSILHII
jgi:hypothetical protein